MVAPVPGYGCSTAYGKRGSYWSCNEDSNGNGIHTGNDYAAPAGTPVVAARGGRVVYVSFGSAFGSHQLAIEPGDGTRDFYAHMQGRAVDDGDTVAAGAKVGSVGDEGNATGPHLHFERHKVDSGGWSCSVIVDPRPSIDSGQDEDEDMDLQDEITEWSPDEGTTGDTTVGKTLNQARGYAEDTYDRVAKLQSKVDALDDKVDKILNAVT
jgi:murein DD-endopeptidase MepM/ murein hydrolase activator NlpD